MLGSAFLSSGGILSLFGHLSPLALLVLVAVGSGICSAFITSDCSALTASRVHISPMRIHAVRATKLPCGLGLGLGAGHGNTAHAAFPHPHLPQRHTPSMCLPKLGDIAGLLVGSLVPTPSASRYRVFDADDPAPSAEGGDPPVTLESLRSRYGTRQSLWGDWDSRQTRQFYKSQLPLALQADGARGLSLGQRAKLASQARYALRLYARERSTLPVRLLSGWYDGLRHLLDFGTWAPEGMNWAEVKMKYTKEAHQVLGAAATPEEVESYLYRRIVLKACSTNQLFDSIAAQDTKTKLAATLLGRGVAALPAVRRAQQWAERAQSSRPMLVALLLVAFSQKQLMASVV